MECLQKERAVECLQKERAVDYVWNVVLTLSSSFSVCAAPAFDFMENALEKFSSEGPFFLGKFGLVSWTFFLRLFSQVKLSYF